LIAANVTLRRNTAATNHPNPNPPHAILS